MNVTCKLTSNTLSDGSLIPTVTIKNEKGNETLLHPVDFKSAHELIDTLISAGAQLISTPECVR